MAATPPPPSPSSLRTPAAPRHGAGYDQYEPYPTRQSARIANRRALMATEKTPEPVCPSSPSKSRSKQHARKYQTVEVDGDEFFSAPGKSAKSNNRHNPGASIPFIAFNDYDLTSRTSHSPKSRSRSTVNQALPTPAKTPSKRKISSLDISSASRTLFQPQSSSRNKKSTPLSLESFDGAGPSNEIQIYTDSRDRIPKPAANMETPFNAKSNQVSASGSAPAPKVGKRARKQDKMDDATVEYKSYEKYDHYGQTDLTDAEASESEEDEIARAGGMTMIFRGKKVFNKFGSPSDEGDDLGLFSARPDLLQDTDLSSVKSLSRSSIRPRRLFAEAAPKPRVAPQIEAEEEATDDEGHVEEEAEAQPHKESKSPYTPQSPEFPRAPGGSRNLRSAARYGGEVDVTPTATALIADNKRKRASPFDHWLRQKPTPDEVTSQSATPTKRGLRSGSPSAPTPKKTRSTRSTVESQSA